jgi:Uma2 family endonuclease
MHSREFLRRYERLPQVKKAELIEGVVYMGSLTRVNDDGYLAGPPELIMEVAASSASIDLRDERRAYCRNGVREHLVWLLAEARLEWFCLQDDDYRPQLPDAQGVLHSRVFPGLRLPVAPLLAGDTAKVLKALTGD